MSVVRCSLAVSVAFCLALCGCGGAGSQVQGTDNVGQPEAEQADAQDQSSAAQTNAQGQPGPGQTSAPDQPEAAASNASDQAKDAAVTALSNRLESMRERLYVYRDFSDSENHFSQRIKMWGLDERAAHDLEEDCADSPHSGATCIRCENDTSAQSWSGWVFVNGYVPEGQAEPVINDESAASRGVDLTGATELHFWARGTKGSVVDFFCCGFGYDGSGRTKVQNNADSCGTRALRNVTLTDEWKEHVIPLEGYDLSNIACGFGYAIDDADYNGTPAVIYLDDIYFTGTMESQQKAPMLLRSYDTDTLEIKNAAFSYDNALVAMAFLSEGKTEQAAELLDALAWAIEHDRYQPGRVRNAYAAGDISPAPGWGEDAKLPGWYDVEARSWYEDAYQVGSNVGNSSYVALAFMHYIEEAHDAGRSDRYLACAQSLMDWVIADCSDGGDGFLAGYDGWPENGSETVHTYKSTEHNIDAYAAFAQLAQMTGDARYDDAAQSALRFVESMYDDEAAFFYTGTQADGKTPDTGNVVLDTQVWSALALGDAFAPYEQALTQLDGMRTAAGGYRFHACDEDAYWCEGTAFTALMHKLRGEDDLATAAFDALVNAQLESGLFPAATADDLSTGIYLSDGSPWLYGTSPHITPTAWFVMARNGYNPYAFS